MISCCFHHNPVLCTRSAQKFLGKKSKNKMKEQKSLQYSAMLFSNVYSRLAMASLLFMIH